MFPCVISELSPDKQISGTLTDFSDLSIFGQCRVYTGYPGREGYKLDNNSRKGIFFGYLVN